MKSRNDGGAPVTPVVVALLQRVMKVVDRVANLSDWKRDPFSDSSSVNRTFTATLASSSPLDLWATWTSSVTLASLSGSWLGWLERPPSDPVSPVAENRLAILGFHCS